MALVTHAHFVDTRLGGTEEGKPLLPSDGAQQMMVLKDHFPYVPSGSPLSIFLLSHVFQVSLSSCPVKWLLPVRLPPPPACAA